MDQKNFSKHASLHQVTITDPFWKAKQQLVADEVIAYQYKALLDEVEGAEKSYCIENFRKAADIVQRLSRGETVPTYPVDKWCYDDNNCEAGAFHGWVFQDSDVYKWLEAVGYVLAQKEDEALRKKADAFIDLICAAQLPNGYLDTLYIINDRDKIFTNLKDFHELYCFGHLTEAAVSYFSATGDVRLLDAACRFADLLCDTFGEDRLRGYPGHEIAEMALVRLYEVTREKKYLTLAKFFIDERGREPFYYDKETGRQTDGTPYLYNQAHKEPRQQREAVGHAVRGVYLYSGMADTCRLYMDEELYTACLTIWNDIITRKLYVTGGIGSTVDGEAFTYAYDLPNDLAYCETCASIGLIFFARRMAELENSAQYGAVMERALYNTVLSGMAGNGKSFFYVNPLEVLPEASRLDSRKRHVKPVRQKWFSCACCPPNLARLISSLGAYIYTENDREICVHLLIGSSLHSDKADVTLTREGDKVTVAVKHKRDCTLTVRNGEQLISYPITKDTEITLKTDEVPRLVKCSNLVRENVGKVCVMKGAIVYCLEGADNGEQLQLLSISSNPHFSEEEGILLADGYRELPDTALYSTYKKPAREKVRLRLSPYYQWANRGENEMCVYMRIHDEEVSE